MQILDPLQLFFFLGQNTVSGWKQAFKSLLRF